MDLFATEKCSVPFSERAVKTVFQRQRMHPAIAFLVKSQ